MPPQPPTKLPTILDVAHRAGVSKSLVSLVMRGSPRVSEASRKAVLQAAKEIGYRPNAVARSLVRQRSFMIGVLLSDLHNPFFAEVVDGLDEAAAAGGYSPLFNTGHLSPHREVDAIDNLLQLRVDGLILAGTVADIAAIVDAGRTVPTVMIARTTRAATVDSVASNDRNGAEKAVDHLVELGHSRIACIHAGSAAGAKSRRTGYERAMHRHHLDEHILSARGAYTEAGGAAGMSRLLETDALPTAVLVANDLAAIGALEVLDRAGLEVPADMSVVGYDDSFIAGMRRVDLTTVHQPRREMGRLAVEFVIERLEGGRTDVRHTLLEPELVVRGSTGPPPRHAHTAAMPPKKK